MKTAPVKELVEEVLATLPSPPGEDAIDDVFCAIEASSEWLQRYQDLCDQLTKDVVKQWGGHWIREAAGGQRGPKTAATSSLLTTYSKLV